MLAKAESVGIKTVNDQSNYTVSTKLAAVIAAVIVLQSVKAIATISFVISFSIFEYNFLFTKLIIPDCKILLNYGSIRYIIINLNYTISAIRILNRNSLVYQ